MRTVEEIKASIATTKFMIPISTNDEYNLEAYRENTLKSLEEELRAVLTTGIPLDRLEQICAADKDGRCVVLPCKVGDAVYKISYDCTKRIRYNPFDENGCSTAEICLKCDTHPCDIHKTVIPVTVKSKDWMWENKAAFGKTVFLTSAEAEKALGKAQDERLRA